MSLSSIPWAARLKQTPASVRDIYSNLATGGGFIKDRYADPDFRPAAVVAETGFSLRYLQKLLTARACTCSELLYSIRLDHAAHLLERRASLGTGQHLSEIAYVCGFRDYAHFARRFRDRFGHAPGAHLEGSGAIGSA